MSFYWSETDATAGGATPRELTAKLTPHHAVMRGTDRRPVRCIALEGAIGAAVRCTIHALRPSPCRELTASWVDGVRNERCDRARLAHGLRRCRHPATLAEPDGVTGVTDPGARPRAQWPLSRRSYT